MAKFFVIDQSLDDVGGHHFDTVRLIAEAASDREFEVIAGTNRKLDVSKFEFSNATIHPVFRNSTYTPLSQLESLRKTTRSRYPALDDIHDPQKGLQFIRRARSAHLQNKQNRFIAEFAEDCEKIFSQYSLQENDHALFLTVNELDFLGLAAYLANNPNSVQANWEVVFHFGIFAGRPCQYSKQRQKLNLIRHAIQSGLAKIPYHQITFLASTEELVDQYNQLQVAHFKMLPYPIDRQIGENVPNQRTGDPIRITLAGGLRREKGKKRISEVAAGVNGMREEGLDVRLTLQVRKRKWYQGPDIKLDLPGSHQQNLFHFVPHPLPEEEYRALIQATDIGLLLYDNQTYYSRRAGILGEYLTAGCPVVVPAGCWLSQQIAEPSFQHIERLIETDKNSTTIGLSTLEHSKNNVPLTGGVVSFDQKRNPFFAKGTLEHSSSGLAIQFDWHWPKQSYSYALVEFRGYDKYNKLVSSDVQVVGCRQSFGSPCLLFSLNDRVRSFELEFSNAYSDLPSSIQNLYLTPLGDGGECYARGAVGFSFVDYSDVPRALAEIIENYSHYARTAAEYSVDWSKYHDPRFTVDFLIGNGTPLDRVA